MTQPVPIVLVPGCWPRRGCTASSSGTVAVGPGDDRPTTPARTPSPPSPAASWPPPRPASRWPASRWAAATPSRSPARPPTGSPGIRDERGREMLIDCAVVGAGPAGLATSAALSARGVEHVVLEQGRVGESWRTQRWASFRLNTPGWMNQLLGEQAPDTYATGVEVVKRLDGLAADCPVREGVPVAQLAPAGDGYACRPARVTSWPARWSWPPATRTCRRSPRWPAPSPTGLPTTTPLPTAAPTSSRTGRCWWWAAPSREHRVAGRGRVHGPATA
jgi:hypothetical protein